MTNSKFKSVDEYINSFPKEVQEVLQKIRKTIQKAAPKAEEVISYGMPTFNLNGSYLIYFAAWKNHISLYPVPSTVDVFQNELAPYLSGEGTAKFPLKKSIPYDLIKKIVQYRLSEHQRRNA